MGILRLKEIKLIPGHVIQSVRDVKDVGLLKVGNVRMKKGSNLNVGGSVGMEGLLGRK